MIDKPVFRSKARLILQLGDQLIRNESVATLEIIKNAYDADASTVTISMNNLDHPEDGKIIIEDDGIGMDYRLISDVWLQLGNDYKRKIFLKKERSKKYGRLPLGEKGIGRFAVHKLGNRIELISKKKDQKEVHLVINWEDFKKDDFLENIEIELTERNPQYFTNKNQTGTKIIISNLRSNWDRTTVRELYRAIKSLNSPFDTDDSFKVLFKIDRQDWLKGLSFKDIKEDALYYGEALIKDNQIVSLKYKFTPWPTMKKINARSITREHLRMVKNIKDPETGKKKQVDIDLSKVGVGTVKLKVLIFDRTPKILSLGVEDKKGLKDYLNHNGGIRVFRDGVRVYDYGEPDNDWLNLNIGRVNRPGVTLSNNIIIGAVDLQRESSDSLLEKTNREGFVENEAYKEFTDAIIFALGKIVLERNMDKDKVRKQYSASDTGEPIIGKLSILTEKIKKNIPSGDLREGLLKDINDIEEDYQTITEVYTRSAGAGLSLGVVIHEVEKIVSELMLVVNEKGNSERIRDLTKHLAKLLDGYTAVIRQGTKGQYELKEIINQSLFNVEFRLKAHHVSIVPKFSEYKVNPSVYCARSLIISVIMNLIDNSMWWLNYGNIKQKKLFIDISREYTGYTTLILADNGPGFTIPAEEAVKPFITDKPDGMGIGLHLANEIMNSHGGELMFPGKGDFDIPREFEKGAIVALAFKDKK